MAPTPPIGGHAEPGYGHVADVFRENFATRGELGASVSVYVEGKHVVDLWGGSRDRQTRAPWQADTLQMIFSATKGLVATSFLLLRERGQLDIDTPVAEYWPGFARAGKQDITVRQLLNHRSGLCAIDKPLTLDDMENWATRRDPSAVVEALEAQEPVWMPGTAQGYHAVSFGPYAGELFFRVAGQTVGSFLRSELTGPLKADVHLGIGEAERARSATLYPTRKRTVLTKILPRLIASKSVEGRMYRRFVNRKSETNRAFANPQSLGVKGIANYNTARVQAMELPWVSAFASARGLSKFYGALVDPDTPLISAPILEDVRRRQSWGWDKVLRKPMGFSQGFVKDELHLYSPSTATFGHPGAGGALGFADPENGIAFGYVMNQMDFRLRSPRAMKLAQAVYRPSSVISG